MCRAHLWNISSKSPPLPHLNRGAQLLALAWRAAKPNNGRSRCAVSPARHRADTGCSGPCSPPIWGRSSSSSSPRRGRGQKRRRIPLSFLSPPADLDPLNAPGVCGPKPYLKLLARTCDDIGPSGRPAQNILTRLSELDRRGLRIPALLIVEIQLFRKLSGPKNDNKGAAGGWSTNGMFQRSNVTQNSENQSQRSKVAGAMKFELFCSETVEQ